MNLVSFFNHHVAKACFVFAISCLAITVISCGDDDLPVNRCIHTQEQKLEQKAKDIEVIKKYFSENNIDESQMQKTESGIYYKVLTPGTGAQVKFGNLAQVHYIGKHLCKDLTSTSCTFDESYTRGAPLRVVVGRENVIAGWHEALQLMHVGEETRFFIPSYLAYGPCGSQTGTIGPNEILVFDLKVVSAQ